MLRWNFERFFKGMRISVLTNVAPSRLMVMSTLVSGAPVIIAYISSVLKPVVGTPSTHVIMSRTFSCCFAAGVSGKTAFNSGTWSALIRNFSPIIPVSFALGNDFPCRHSSMEAIDSVACSECG